jgi:CAAD domains of cyanobacterial aminoacyl-tRNA synthetase
MADAPAPAPDADQPVSVPQPEISSPVEPTAAAISPEPDAIRAPGTVAALETIAAPEPIAPPEPASAPAAAAALTSEPEHTPTPAPVAIPTPPMEPEPPAPAQPSPAPFRGVPELASTLELPANPEASAGGQGEGGEWELLLQKLRHWLASGQLQQQWQAARGPLSLLAGLIAVLLVVRIYSALLAVLDNLPLVPGLLELVGLVVVTRFSLTRLVRSDERRAVIHDLQQRWQAFRGKA